MNGGCVQVGMERGGWVSGWGMGGRWGVDRVGDG